MHHIECIEVQLKNAEVTFDLNYLEKKFMEAPFLLITFLTSTELDTWSQAAVKEANSK